MKFILHEGGIRINDFVFGPNQKQSVLLQYHRRFKNGFIIFVNSYYIKSHPVTCCGKQWHKKCHYLFIYLCKQEQ